ncbi:PREDICTED: uncharacterized protein LOC108503200 [Lepidothrix coronata]|uniref:Uncharacterized protein LOC108503200 n=1 Tax=Lepidothrix coronata TaxID=321398 RepID=A0A6J0I712_9PASS|nr:PREDICTED: uncharacterized protein LOC108503200 [Lepidothrix coronata]
MHTDNCTFQLRMQQPAKAVCAPDSEVHKPWDETEVVFVCSGKLFMSREASKSSKIQLPQILFFLLQRNVTARYITHNLEKVPVHYHRMKTPRHKKNWKKNVLLVLVLLERFCHPATCRSGLKRKTPKYERGVFQLIPQPRSTECWKHVKHPALQSSSLESRSLVRAVTLLKLQIILYRSDYCVSWSVLTALPLLFPPHPSDLPLVSQLDPLTLRTFMYLLLLVSANSQGCGPGSKGTVTEMTPSHSPKSSALAQRCVGLSG